MAASSLLAAAKSAADLAGIPWGRANMFYRSLQQEGHVGSFLPTSRGRAIAQAHRILVARFVIGLVTSDHPDDIYMNVLRFAFYTESGRDQPENGLAPVTLEQAFAHALRPTAPPTRVIFSTSDLGPYVQVLDLNAGTEILFRNGFRPSGLEFTEPRQSSNYIRRSVTIEPEFFAELLSSVDMIDGGPLTRAGKVEDELATIEKETA